MRASGVAVGLVVALTIGAAAAVLHARDAGGDLPVSGERLMYLRSGRTADRLFLTFDAVAADVYWMRAIQHYGRDRRSPRLEGRFELLEPLLDLTTTLDPYFNIAYRFGAIFLSMDPPNGPGRPDQAIALLEKGLRHRPDRWQYAHDIGFVHYWHTGDYLQAAQWFERAAEMPDAPEWIRQVAAVTRAEGGDRQGARQLLSEILNADEDYIRGAAARSLAQLDALDAIDQLTAVVERYRRAEGHLPQGWTELVSRGYLRGVPLDRAGLPFIYDASSGRVALHPSSDLLPLPYGMRRD